MTPGALLLGEQEILFYEHRALGSLQFFLEHSLERERSKQLFVCSVIHLFPH